MGRPKTTWLIMTGAIAVAAVAAIVWSTWDSEPAQDEEAPPVARSSPEPVVDTGTPRPRQVARPEPPPAPATASAEPRPIERLRAQVDEDPRAAVTLAREWQRAAPDSPHADERAFLLMRALVHLGDITAAREEARRFYARHTESPFGERVFQLTGVHPPLRHGPR